jgi:hypothetical protein
MFPNVRLMAASTCVSVMALFFAFGVYASLRVSHSPLARSSRAASLQLVGFNVAMLPVTVLEPFADPHPAPAAADNSAVLAYSAAQAAPPQTASAVAITRDAHADNAAADEPAENSDVTQMQITGALETAPEPKAPDTPAPGSAELARSMEQSTADTTPPPASPAAAASAAAPPQIPPAQRTAAIETIPAAVAEPAAATDDWADDTDIVPKKKKKKHIARRHLYRIPLRAVAQTPPPQQQSSIWPAGIGGPLVAAPKH